MPVSEETMQGIVGWRFPGGTKTIEHWENYLLTDVMLSDQLPDGMCHPAFCFSAPMGGMGITMAEFFDVCHAESAEAVRAGEYVYEIHRPLREYVEYDVRGEILGVERKRGRRAGLFDNVTFQLQLVEPDGEPAVTVTNSWIFLRSEDDE